MMRPVRERSVLNFARRFADDIPGPMQVELWVRLRDPMRGFRDHLDYQLREDIRWGPGIS